VYFIRGSRRNAASAGVAASAFVLLSIAWDLAAHREAWWTYPAVPHRGYGPLSWYLVLGLAMVVVGLVAPALTRRYGSVGWASLIIAFALCRTGGELVVPRLLGARIIRLGPGAVPPMALAGGWLALSAVALAMGPLSDRAVRGLGRRPVRYDSLAPHLVAFIVLLIVLVPTMHLHSGWQVDDGSYALEVHDLQRGSWQQPYAGATIDPASQWFPVGGTTIQGRHYSYVSHPADVILPWVSVKAVGAGIGYDLPSLVGAVLAALAAWLLVAEIETRAAPLAFWLVALSPVLINAYLLWAHALSAGVAGLTAYCGVRAARTKGRLLPLLGLVGGAAAGVFLRSEGIIFGIAAVVVFGLATMAQGARRRGAAVVVVGLTAVAAARKIETWGISRIVGRTSFAGTPDAVRQVGGVHVGYVDGRLRGTWHDLLQGSIVTHHADRLLLGGLAAVVVAGAALRWGRRLWLPAFIVGSLTALVLYLVRFASYPGEAAAGLFAAWPVAALGLLCLRWRSMSTEERWLLAMVAIVGAGVAAADYPVGGSSEWGGRFFSPIIVPLSALVALALWRRLSANWVPAGALILALAVFPAAAGVRVVQRDRANGDRVYRELAARSSSLVVVDLPTARGMPPSAWSSDPRVLWLSNLPRLAWRLDPRTSWLVTPRDTTESALSLLHSHGVDDVTVLMARGAGGITTAPFRTSVDVTGPVLSGSGYRLVQLQG